MIAQHVLELTSGSTGPLTMLLDTSEERSCPGMKWYSSTCRHTSATSTSGLLKPFSHQLET